MVTPPSLSVLYFALWVSEIPEKSGFFGGVRLPSLKWTIFHYLTRSGKAWRNLELHKALRQKLLLFAACCRRLLGRIFGLNLAAFLAAIGN
jgi:hypothetical protein